MLTDKYLKYYKSEKVRTTRYTSRDNHFSGCGGANAHSPVCSARSFPLHHQTQNVQPLGLVFLRSVSKIERGVEGPNGMIDAFALTTPDRVYTFACANDREVRQWLDALKPYVNATGKVPEVLKEGWLVKQGGSVKVDAARPLGSIRRKRR